MLKKVKNMMISKAVKVAEVFTKEEKGASDIVAIIVIIAIILVVAAIFREQLTAAVTTVFENLTDFIGKDADGFRCRESLQRKFAQRNPVLTGGENR